VQEWKEKLKKDVKAREEHIWSKHNQEFFKSLYPYQIIKLSAYMIAMQDLPD
jgi:hypothetical protein